MLSVHSFVHGWVEYHGSSIGIISHNLPRKGHEKRKKGTRLVNAYMFVAFMKNARIEPDKNNAG